MRFWDWDDLHRLEAEGRAERLVDQGLWIVIREDRTKVVVRDSQVLVSDRDAEWEIIQAQAREERYLPEPEPLSEHDALIARFSAPQER